MGEDKKHLVVIIVIVGIFILLTILLFPSVKNIGQSSQIPSQTPATSVVPSSQSPSQSPTITADEKVKIDAWIQKNGLNTYGDPLDTAYTGGTPLFNESTGVTLDRYEYILINHPARPWRN